jgi:hypothetical protein
MPGAQHAQVEHQRFDALVDLHRDARGRRQVQRVEQVGDIALPRSRSRHV